MISPASFRMALPAFKDALVYPDANVLMWIALAQIMLRPERWGGQGSNPPVVPPTEIIDFGYLFFTAHNLVLEQQAQASVDAGGAPDGPSGPVGSEGVGPVSVSYDVAAGLNPNDGIWNLTIYGRRFAQLANMAGAGGLILGGHRGYGFAFGAQQGIGFDGGQGIFNGPIDYLTGLSN